MSRLLFKGPQGRPWVGKTLRMITPDDARNRDLWELQTQSGLTMPAINEFFAGEKTVLGPATAVIQFLTLRNAGFMVDWDEVLDMGPADFEEIVEPELEEAPDPTAPAGRRRRPRRRGPGGRPRAVARDLGPPPAPDPRRAVEPDPGRRVGSAVRRLGDVRHRRRQHQGRARQPQELQEVTSCRHS